MTRALAIAVTLLAFSAVLSASVAYALPAGAGLPAATAIDDVCIAVAPAGPAVTGKICVKRHSQGLPCTPVPAILPVAYALPEAPTAEPPQASLSVEELDRTSLRLFRPPRQQLV